jgi:hypothetical protein
LADDGNDSTGDARIPAQRASADGARSEEVPRHAGLPQMTVERMSIALSWNCREEGSS